MSKVNVTPMSGPSNALFYPTGSFTDQVLIPASSFDVPFGPMVGLVPPNTAPTNPQAATDSQFFAPNYMALSELQLQRHLSHIQNLSMQVRMMTESTQMLLSRMAQNGPANESGGVPIPQSHGSPSHEPRSFATQSTSCNTSYSSLPVSALSQFSSATPPTTNNCNSNDNGSNSTSIDGTDSFTDMHSNPLPLITITPSHGAKKSGGPEHTSSSSEECAVENDAGSHDDTMAMVNSPANIAMNQMQNVNGEFANGTGSGGHSTSEMSSVVEFSHSNNGVMINNSSNMVPNGNGEVSSNGLAHNISNNGTTRIIHSEEMGRAFQPQTSNIGSPYLGQHFPFASFLAMNQSPALLRPMALPCQPNANSAPTNNASVPLSHNRPVAPPSKTIGDIIKSELAKMQISGLGLGVVGTELANTTAAQQQQASSPSISETNAMETEISNNNSNSNAASNNNNNSGLSAANGNTNGAGSPTQNAQPPVGSRMTLLSSISLSGVSNQNEFAIRSVAMMPNCDKPSEVNLTSTVFLASLGEAGEKADFVLIPTLRRKPFASCSKVFQNTTDDSRLFVAAIKDTLLQEFHIDQLKVSLDGNIISCTECKSSQKSFKQYFQHSRIICFRLPSNDPSSGVKIWEMRKQYSLKCAYGQYKSNMIQLVFDKVGTNKNVFKSLDSRAAGTRKTKKSGQSHAKSKSELSMDEDDIDLDDGDFSDNHSLSGSSNNHKLTRENSNGGSNAVYSSGDRNNYSYKNSSSSDNCNISDSSNNNSNASNSNTKKTSRQDENSVSSLSVSSDTKKRKVNGNGSQSSSPETDASRLLSPYGVLAVSLPNVSATGSAPGNANGQSPPNSTNKFHEAIVANHQQANAAPPHPNNNGAHAKSLSSLPTVMPTTASNSPVQLMHHQTIANHVEALAQSGAMKNIKPVVNGPNVSMNLGSLNNVPSPMSSQEMTLRLSANVPGLSQLSQTPINTNGPSILFQQQQQIYAQRQQQQLTSLNDFHSAIGTGQMTQHQLLHPLHASSMMPEPTGANALDSSAMHRVNLGLQSQLQHNTQPTQQSQQMLSPFASQHNGQQQNSYSLSQSGGQQQQQQQQQQSLQQSQNMFHGLGGGSASIGMDVEYNQPKQQQQQQQQGQQLFLLPRSLVPHVSVDTHHYVIDSFLSANIVPSYDEAVVRFATLRDDSLDAVLVHLMMLHSLLDRQPLRESLVAKSFLTKYIQRNPGKLEVRAWVSDTFAANYPDRLQALQQYSRVDKPIAQLLRALLAYNLDPNLETELSFSLLLSKFQETKIYFCRRSLAGTSRDLYFKFCRAFWSEFMDKAHYNMFPSKCCQEHGFEIVYHDNAFKKHQITMMHYRYFRYSTGLNWQPVLDILASFTLEQFDNYMQRYFTMIHFPFNLYQKLEMESLSMGLDQQESFDYESNFI